MKKNNFEESLEALEKIVEKLEGGDLLLDDSLKFFEKGVKLYKNCKGELEKAEKKILKLSESLNEEELES